MRTSRTGIIAEAGINHDGSIETALAMVDAAAEAGADIVKFQSFSAEALVTPDAEMSSYIVAGKAPEESFRDVLRRLEIDRAGLERLAERCAERGIEFLSTPFHVEALDTLLELGMQRVKIASGDLTHLPLLQAIAERGKPMILSTGMGTLGEIEEAVATIVERGGNDQLSLMHCVSWYPAEIDDVQLRYMETLRQAFGLPVGYSDHTLGTSAAIAARALGATWVERHYTLDRTWKGTDHAASLEPDGLRKLVRNSKAVAQALCYKPEELLEIELPQRKKLKWGEFNKAQ